MVTICRCCTLELQFPEGIDLLECPACGTRNARPKAEGMTLDILKRATELRLHGDFHNAENSYQFVLQNHPDEHEALWGLALCRYGVEYVRDPRTQRLTPTVHFTRPKPLQADFDFQKACSLAPMEVRQQYQADAAYIDDAQAAIRELAHTGDAFDVFICHKTTRMDGSGDFTKDYHHAFQLYHRLDKLGYRVFFAPEAGLKPGADYEAGIYHALSTAKVMLLVCVNREHLTSPWVQSEWSRYLELLDGSGDKLLVPLMYEGFHGYDLPVDIRFRKLQGVTMGELDSLERLLQLLKETLGTPERFSPEDDFITQNIPGGCEITNYKGMDGEAAIPPVIRGKKVLSIGKGAFSRKGWLKTIQLPEGIVSIGEEAFRDCSGLAEFTLPASVAGVGAYAFMGCSGLRSIRVAEDSMHYYSRDDALFSWDGTLLCCPEAFPKAHYAVPEGVKRIADAAFAGCTGLTGITLPQTVEAIGSCAFMNCERLSEITLPDSVQTIGKWCFGRCGSLRKVRLPAGLTEIGEWLFGACRSLTEATLPDGLRAIGKTAFAGCESLTDMALSAQVEAIGEDAFVGCAALTLRVHEGSPAHRYARESGAAYRLISSGAQESDFKTEAAEGGCAIAKYRGKGGRVTIPGEIGGQPVVAIGNGAFDGCVRLSEVILPESVKAIGEKAFHGCTGLTQVSLPEGLTRIGNMAFNGCASLTDAALPQGLMALGHYVFFGCSALTSVTLPEGLPEIGVGVFHGCGSLTDVEIPQSVTAIGRTAFGSCGKLASLTLPEGVQHIDKVAFAGCAALTLRVHAGSAAHAYAQKNGIAFALLGQPPQADSIPQQPAAGYFSPEADFETADMGSGCTIVKYRGNGGDVSVPPVIRGKQVLDVAESAFNSAGTLTGITLPEGITALGDRAFFGCKQLKYINLPGSLRSIGVETFWCCEALTELVIPEGVTELRKQAVYGCRALTKAELPTTLRTIGVQAFQCCSALQEIILPEGLTRVEWNAFDMCDQLRAVSLPVSLTSIGRGAFESCGSLQEIDLPPRLSCIEMSMFDGCVELARVGLPDGLQTIGQRAFALCRRLKAIDLPAGLTGIGKSAFWGAGALETIVIPEQVSLLGGHAFESCSGLKKVEIRGAIKKLEAYTFNECHALETVTLPDTLEEIGDHAFDSCIKLTQLNIPARATKFGANVFDNCLKLPEKIRKLSGNTLLGKLGKWLWG